MLRVEPWQHVPAARMAALYETQRQAWRQELAWETAATWPTLDDARRTGRVAGAVVHDGAALAGWAYWVYRGGELHCGALVATSADATRLLTDAVCRAADAHTVTRLVVFTYPVAPGVAEALHTRGFAVHPYDYFVRPLDGDTEDVGAPTRAWDVRDLDATAALFSRSYAHEESHPFAGRGTAADWRAYARDLTLTDGCGRFRPSLSRSAAGSAGRLDGVALVTDLGARTAHLAQLAVDPLARGRGLGRALLEAVAVGSRRAGLARVTLLVSRTNAAARRLYLASGYSPRASFLAATRPGANGVPSAATSTSREAIATPLLAAAIDE